MWTVRENCCSNARPNDGESVLKRTPKDRTGAQAQVPMATMALTAKMVTMTATATSPTTHLPPSPNGAVSGSRCG